MIVIHDDMDLKLGQIKAKCGGSSGGHNGIKSIDSQISPNYNRIRIGVGHPAHQQNQVIDYVLSSFGREEKEILNQSIDTVADLIDILIKNGLPDFCNALGQRGSTKK